MYYQIMTAEDFRKEVQDTAEDWNDGRDELTMQEVLDDLLGTKIDQQWGIIFDSADELEERTDRFSKAVYTSNEAEANKALGKYFGDEYAVYSMRDMAEAIVEAFEEVE